MWIQVAIAYIVDLAFGDPRGIPHPVVLIGRLISFLEKLFLAENAGKARKIIAGIVTVIVVIVTSVAVTWGIIKLAMIVDSRLGFVVSIWLISTTIATKGLIDSARAVALSLSKGDLKEARSIVSNIVGRDTGKMRRIDVVRATIESVAENAVDGVIAPIIFALIGGAPLAMAYRAANTLDSMIGYRNERYKDFGWAAARLDDVLNYIPARISVGIIAIAAFLHGRNAKKVVRVAMRDGRNHASPNSGLPEAAVAGAFGFQLGGTNYYGGVARKSGFIGEGKSALTEKNISDVVVLIFIASAVTILTARAVLFVISYVLGL